MSGIIDKAAYDEAKAMLGAKFSQMVSYYLEDAEGYISEINTAVKAGNANSVTAPAHTLKSSSLQMGAVKLSMIAKEIEILARTGANEGKISQLSTQLSGVFKETAEEMLKN